MSTLEPSSSRFRREIRGRRRPAAPVEGVGFGPGSLERTGVRDAADTRRSLTGAGAPGGRAGEALPTGSIVPAGGFSSWPGVIG